MGTQQLHEFLIDARKYQTSPLRCTVSRGLNLRLVKAIGPSIGAVAMSGKSGTSIEGILRQALDAIDTKLLDDLCDAFSQVTRVDGVPELLDEAGFNAHFSGRLFSMYKWLFECLKFEYADFFEGLPNLINGQQVDQAKASESQST